MICERTGRANAQDHRITNRGPTSGGRVTGLNSGHSHRPKRIPRYILQHSAVSHNRSREGLLRSVRRIATHSSDERGFSSALARADAELVHDISPEQWTYRPQSIDPWRAATVTTDSLEDARAYDTLVPPAKKSTLPRLTPNLRMPHFQNVIQSQQLERSPGGALGSNTLGTIVTPGMLLRDGCQTDVSTLREATAACAIVAKRLLV